MVGNGQSKRVHTGHLYIIPSLFLPRILPTTWTTWTSVATESSEIVGDDYSIRGPCDQDDAPSGRQGRHHLCSGAPPRAFPFLAGVGGFAAP
jgi:hypothetical protein